MRIAMLTNNYKPFVGGVPISIERLTNSLRELGHEVFIFAPAHENQEEEEGVIRFKSFNNYVGNDNIPIPNILDKHIEEKFQELNIDIIHVHHPMLMGWSALYLGEKYKVPVTFTYHTRLEQYAHYLKPLKKLETIAKNNNNIFKDVSERILNLAKDKAIPWTTKVVANRCQTVFAPTELMREYLEDVGVKAEIQVMPTGLSDKSFIYDNKKVKEIRNKYLGDKKYLFCTVSRIAKEKNIEFIIDGMKKLRDEKGNDFKLMVIGDGPLKETLISTVKELGLEENIEFLGNVKNTEILNYYKAADIFLFASKSETQGIVLLEAMAAKRPVVAIEASGVVEVVKNNENGFMTEENLDSWVEKVFYLMENKIERERLSNGAYKTAKQYTSRRVAKRAEYIYQEAKRSYEERYTTEHYGEVYEKEYRKITISR